MPASSRPAINSKTHLSIALLDAASRFALGADPDEVLALLAPAVAAIEAEARALQDDADAARAALAAERQQRAIERTALVKLREQADRDALGIIAAGRADILQNPYGHYVYYLRGHAEQILYIGMSTNILQRLGKHVGTRGRGSMIARIDVVECKTERSMRRLEGAAIREHQPPWNVQGIVA